MNNLANTDALTNLLNRRALVALIEQRIGAGALFAIVLLDLDGFKGVNDRLGHPAGDALLRVVGQRLGESCGARGSVGRLGGDEFLVVLHAVQGAEDVNARAATLLSELCQPTQLKGESVPVDASLGFAIFGRDGTTTADLMAAADEALYANKRVRIGQRSTGRSTDRRQRRTS